MAELERIARRQGRPTAHVIRDALDQYVTANGAEVRVLPGFIGIGRGPGDVAERAEQLLAEHDDPADT